MGAYATAAQFYDALYHGDKDYGAEAELVAATIRALHPDAVSLLDVGCGTAAHGRHLVEAGFAVDGIDLEPAFVEQARAKIPGGEFVVADMRSFQLPKRYDAIVSLFSAIGYVRDEAGLVATLERMAAHLKPGGVLVVDPWFEPGVLTHGWIATVEGEANGTKVVRMSRTLVEGAISRLEFEYLVGDEDGIQRLSETHELGLFTQAQMESAFRSAGLTVERRDGALRTRGMYVGQRATAG